MKNRVAIFSDFGPQSEFLSIEYFLRFFKLSSFNCENEIVIDLEIAVVIANIIVFVSGCFLC